MDVRGAPRSTGKAAAFGWSPWCRRTRRSGRRYPTSCAAALWVSYLGLGVTALSALAGLSRQVGTEQGCALSAPVFDGRQRSDFTAGNGRREVILPWRDAWRGEALRCEVEGVQVAGFRFDGQWRENATPRRAVAWIAPPYAGAPPVPVRVDMPSRWFGTATAVLLRAEPMDRLQARPAERRADLAR